MSCIDIGQVNKLKNQMKNRDLVGVKDTLTKLLTEYNIDSILQICKKVTFFPKAGNEAYTFLSNPNEVRKFLTSPTKSDSANPESKDMVGKEAAIDNPLQVQQNVRRQNNWLHKSWGLYDLSRMKFLKSLQRDFNNYILEPLYNSKGEPLEEAVNRYIKNYITFRINSLKKYLDSRGIDTSVIDKNMPFEYGVLNPEERIQNILKAYRNIFYNNDGSVALNGNQLAAYENSNTKKEDQDYAQAFADYLIIDPFHFDSFIKTNVGSLEVKNSIGKLSALDNKYGLRLGHGKTTETWQQEDATYVVSQSVDDFVQIAISSWPKYRRNSLGIWVSQPNEYADVNSVVNVFSKIMSLSTLKSLRDGDKYDSELSDIIKQMKETFRGYFGSKTIDGKRVDVIDSIIEEYIEGKTIADIIDTIPQDYEHLIPITFYLLINDGIIDNIKYDSDNKSKVYINENDKVNIGTIYKNMFDPNPSEEGKEDSLFRRESTGSNFDIYQMICQIFLTHDRKEIFGILESPDGVSKNYYSVGRANQRLNFLQNTLKGLYFPQKELNIPRTTITTDFQEGKDKIVSIVVKPFSLSGNNNEYKIEIVNGKTTSLFINGIKERLSQDKAKEVLNDLKVFFKNTLKMDFISNEQPLLDIYKGLLEDPKYPVTWGKVLNNLLTLSSRFIYAHEVSKVLQGLSTRDFRDKVSNYYDGTRDKKLAQGVSYNQLDPFADNYAMMSVLSMANDIHDGIAGNVIVKGGNGEQINSVVLKSLSTQFRPWFSEKAKDVGNIPSAIKHFSVKDAIKRISFFRDYVNKKGEVKSATSMSVEELFYANFIYDFYGEDSSNSADSVYGTTMGVFSDKPNLGRVEIYRHTEIPTGEVDTTGLPIKKAIKDLTHEELKRIATRELGIFYDRMVKEMRRNLTILNKYSDLAQRTGYDNFYSIDNDYKHTRKEFTDKQGNIIKFSKSDLQKDIHNAIVKAQNANEDIEINEFLYFFWDKNGNLHAKHSIFSEIDKNGPGAEAFFNRKEAELVVNILQDLKQGIRFTDNNGITIDSPAIRALKTKNKNWITRDNLILAKIKFGETSKNLVSKRDIVRWKEYGRLQRFIKDNPNILDASRLNINGDFDLLYFLEVINDKKLRKQIDDYYRLNEFKSKAKQLLKKKYAEQYKDLEITDKQKEQLVKDYQAWRIKYALSQGNELSEEELKEITDNYIINSDSNKWKERYISSLIGKKLDTITNIKSFIKNNGLEELSDLLTKEYSTNSEYTLEINPELQRYNTLGYLFSEETLNSTVGSSVNHEVKSYTENLQLLGAIESAAQTKRNVAETGSKNQYTRGNIKGMNPTMRIAVMEDMRAGVSTVNGIQSKGAIKPMDGATIGNYSTRQQERFSLGSQSSGIDNSKPLGNDLNQKTGTGTIIKTAVFVLTNGRIRSSEENIRLHRVMTHIPWSADFDGNFLEDFDGNKIQYKPIIFYNPTTQKYYLRTNLNIIQGDGRTSFDEIEINNEIINASPEIQNIIKTGYASEENLDKFEKLGLSVKRNKMTNRPIRTNYELWDLFGGAYSASFNGTELSYGNDNTSLENVYIAETSVGERTTEGLLTRPTNADVWLPLKEAKIDWIVTAGAIKQGAANINSTKLMTEDGYPITTQVISTADIGMQLNPEHNTDKSTVTLMTQVVNALGLRGYSADHANRVYQALANLTNLNLKELFDGIDIDMKTGDDKALKDAMSSLILKSIIGTSETGGDLLSSIVVQLKTEERNGHDYDILKHKLPISDPYILNKIVSNIAATIGKMGIRISFPGSMNVLVPSDGIYKIVGGQVNQIYNTTRYYNQDELINSDEEIEETTEIVDKNTGNVIKKTEKISINSNQAEQRRLKKLQEESDRNPKKLHQITIGASYIIRLDPGQQFDSSNPLTVNILSGKSIKIDDLDTYYQVRDLLKGKSYTMVEDIAAGRDLAPYNCTFDTIGGESFMLWDLDSIRHIHMAETNPSIIENIRQQYTDEQIRTEFHINPSQLDRSSASEFLKDFKTLIHRRKQVELNAIGSGNNSIVYINGEKKRIIKGSTVVSPYELIASKNYATTFGLKVGDNLTEISQDRNYFLKKFVNQQLLQSNSADSNNYDIVLKTISGKNYYLLYQGSETKIPSDLQPISDEQFYNNLDWVGEKCYRLDFDGHRLYELPYTKENGKITFNAKIYTDSKGNEIIYTNNITNFVNNLNYNNIEFSPHILNSDLIKVLQQIGDSKNSQSQRFVNAYISAQDKTMLSIENPDEKTLISINSIVENIKTSIATSIENRQENLEALQTALQKGWDINVTDYDDPIIRQIIISGIETHTSFLKSLDYIVSRTPAQSHQSFMPMKLVAFDESGVNSAYVNRMQLYLQGSDFDVDKASLLGSVFHNGKYVRWSPFMSLSSIEMLKASETLPFPSGKELDVYDEALYEQFSSKQDSINKEIEQLSSKKTLTKQEEKRLVTLKQEKQKFEILKQNKERFENEKIRVYDRMDKPINILQWEDDRVLFEMPGIDYQIALLKRPIDGIWVTNITLEQYNNLSSMSKYIIRRALADKIPEGEQFLPPFDISDLGFDNNVKNSNLYNYSSDQIEFSLVFDNIYDENGRIKDDPESLISFAVALNAYNSFNGVYYIPKVFTSPMGMTITKGLRRDIDKHNIYFNGKGTADAKDAVINFVSSNMFQISCDPVNLVQAMTSVDFQTEIIKDIANQSPLAKQATHFDKGNQMTTFRQARLTLSGKQNTGIEASSLKVYEAFNQYVSVILNYGTAEQQEALLSKPINIAGKEINLISNAYCKNNTNIKHKILWDALQQVDNDEDSAIWLSAFLSLSTDNAKDPTLSKINANPEMIGLYNAGFVLGLPIDILTNIMLSPAANAIMDIQAGNIFYGKNGESNVTSALKFLEKGPDFSYLDNYSLTLIKSILTASAGLDQLNIKKILIDQGKEPTEKNIKEYKKTLKNQGKDSREINAKNLLGYLMPNKFSEADLILARKLVSAMKSKAFGDIEEVYNPLNLEDIVNKKLKSVNYKLREARKSKAATEATIEERAQNNKQPTKKNIEALERANVDIYNYETQVEQLEDIITSLNESSILPNKSGSIYDWAKAIQQKLKDIETVDMNLSNISNDKDEQTSKRTIKKFFQDVDAYLDMREQIIYGEKIRGLDGNQYYPLNIIEQLNNVAQEMSLIRPILGLNQQLPNSKENQLAFVRRFENVLQEKLSGKKASTNEIKALNDLNKQYNISENQVSIERFAFDSEYRQTAIDAYGSIMTKINILDVIDKVPHYFGYLRTMAGYHYGMSKFSIQYRTQDEIAKKVIRGYMKVNSKEEIEQYLKQASRYVSRVLNNMFMLQQNISFNIPNKGKIVLGTTEGNIAFKEWMESEVIPKYKISLSNNNFIQALNDLPYNRTDNRNTVISFTSGIDAMSNNEVDRLKFARISQAFSDLSMVRPESKSGLPLTNLFFYYDLIAYDRQPSQMCLTPIFNNLVAGGQHKLANDYIAFISDLDQNGSSIITFDNQTIDSIARFIAPVVSIYAIDEQKLPYIFVKDPTDQQVKLLRRKEEESDIDPELQDMIVDNLSDYTEDFTGYVDIEGFSEETEFSLDYKLNQPDCKYELVGNGSSIKNPYLMQGNKAYTEVSQYSVLDGRAIATSTKLTIGSETLEIVGNQEFNSSEKFQETLDKYAKGVTIDDLKYSIKKNVDEKGNTSYIFDMSSLKNMLENPCK